MKYDLEKYHLALSQLHMNYFGPVSGGALTQEQNQNLAIKTSLVHRAGSIRYHIDLLRRVKEDTEKTSKPSDMIHPNEVVNQIQSLQKPAEIFYEDMIFNFGSYYDYLAKMIALFFTGTIQRIDWRRLVKEMNKTTNREQSIFSGKQIEDSLLKSLIEINRQRIHPLYDYRSHLIHNESDKFKGKQSFNWVNSEPEKVSQRIIIDIPKYFLETSKQLSGFQVKSQNKAPDLFDTSEALYLYFWNTNISILNLIIGQSNLHNKIHIENLTPIGDGV